MPDTNAVVQLWRGRTVCIEGAGDSRDGPSRLGRISVGASPLGRLLVRGVRPVRRVRRVRRVRGPRRVRGGRRLVIGRAQHVLELRHVLHDVADLDQREAVLARRRRFAFAGVAQDL